MESPSTVDGVALWSRVHEAFEHWVHTHDNEQDDPTEGGLLWSPPMPAEWPPTMASGIVFWVARSEVRDTGEEWWRIFEPEFQVVVAAAGTVSEQIQIHKLEPGRVLGDEDPSEPLSDEALESMTALLEDATTGRPVDTSSGCDAYREWFAAHSALGEFLRKRHRAFTTMILGSE